MWTYNHFFNPLKVRRAILLLYLWESPREKKAPFSLTTFHKSNHICNTVNNGSSIYHTCYHLTETAFKLSNKQPVDYLSQITNIKSSIERPEPYSPERTGEDIVPSSNPDSPVVCFDVWSDLEEDIVNYVINSLATDKEQFKNSSQDAHGEKVIFVIIRAFPSRK